MSKEKALNHRPKLSAEQQREVCGLIAAGYGALRITQHFEEHYGISLNPTTLHVNYIRKKRWQPLINKLRAKMDANLANHCLASKTNRLDIIKEAIDECLTWRLDKIYYDANGKELSRIEKRNVTSIARLVEQARKEVDGDQSEGANLEVNMYNIIKDANKTPEGVMNGISVTRKGDPILDKFLEK